LTIVELKCRGDALASSVPTTKAAVLKHFHFHVSIRAGWQIAD
jgi:hypothetical protein